MKAVPAQLALGLVNTWYAAMIAWRVGSGSSNREPGGGPSSSRDVGLGQVGGNRGPTAAWTAAGHADGQEALTNALAAGVAESAAAAPGSPPASRLPGVVDTAVMGPRNAGAGLRSRAGQQSSGL